MWTLRRLWAVLPLIFGTCLGGLTATAATVPEVDAAIPAQQLSGTAPTTLDLSKAFRLPGVTGQVVQVATTYGTFNMELLANDAPATVKNFLFYMTGGAYTNTLIHRSVPGFIIQTGGFKATLPIMTIAQKAPVVNEFKVSNTRGTVAMAKVGTDPNSATNQWFVSLADNSANLDTQNGGFTVFAQVLGTGMSVPDAIAAIPVYNAGSPLDQIPLRDVVTGQTVIKLQNFVVVTSVAAVPIFPPPGSARSAIAFSVENSNHGILTATLNGSTLMLFSTAKAGGTASVTVHATDTNGNSAAQTFAVSVPDPTPVTAGTFSGLVGDGQIGSGTSSENMAAFLTGNGFLSLTYRADKSFTGSLRLEGQTLALKGNFDMADTAAITVKRAGKSDARVSLSFDPTPPGKITGTVTTGGTPMAFEALPGLYTGTKNNPHPLSGMRYTVILPAPDSTLGHGYATLAVAPNGTAAISGKLADGTAFTTTVGIVDDGTGSWLVPVHIPLYSGSRGLLHGEVLLPMPETSGGGNVLGGLGWLRPPITNATLFPLGFLKALDPAGKPYQPQKDISIFSGSASTADFTVTVDPAVSVLSAPVTQAGAWPKNNIPVLPKSAGIKLTFTGATGAFKGTFSRTVNGKPVSTVYEGVILASPLTLPGKSATVQGGGFFPAGTATGPVEISSQ